MASHHPSCPHYPRQLPSADGFGPFGDLLGVDFASGLDPRTQNLYFEGFIRGSLAMKHRHMNDVDGHLKRARGGVYVDDGASEGWKCLFQAPPKRHPCPACVAITNARREERHTLQRFGSSSASLSASADGTIAARRPSNVTLMSQGTAAGGLPIPFDVHRNLSPDAPLQVVGRGVGRSTEPPPRRLSL